MTAPRLATARGPAPIADVARLLADPSRASMLDALLDGDAHPIGALARGARVSAATASSHIAKLAAAGLVSVAPEGRQRLVRLAGPEVAEVLERLAALASPHTKADALRFARTCYDHLAGVLGVVVAGALVDRGWLYRTSDTFEPAPALLGWLAAHGQPVDLAAKRPLSRACTDWTERVPHLAGQVGAALARVFLDERWVARIPGGRTLRLTDRGRAALARELSLSLASR